MKILVIEDDEKLGKALKLGLERDGFAVDVVLDGEIGERRLKVNHMNYDLVILDLILPKLSGIEVCKSIRAKGILLPILILTGMEDTSDKVAGLDAGADDYLTKPFSVQELLARVRALLRRPKEVLPTELHVRDVVLNPSTRKVHRAGNEIPLTLKEFGVLEYFMRHPNQVVNREQILDHVWDFDFASFSNIIDVHINNLRKKLNAGGEENYLETIRGVGYRFKT